MIAFNMMLRPTVLQGVIGVFMGCAGALKNLNRVYDACRQEGKMHADCGLSNLTSDFM